MKRILVILIVFVTCLGMFSSCAPPDFEGNYFYIIENNSDSSVYLNYEINSHEKSQIINKYSSDTILEEWIRNAGEYDLGDEFLTKWFDKFSIYSDSLNQNKIKKNYEDRNNWEYYSISHGNKKRSDGDNYYTLKLINSSF